MGQTRLLAATLLSVLACILGGCGQGEERSQLVQKVAGQLEEAKAKAGAYDFEAAYGILRALPDEVKKSSSADAATYTRVLADIAAVRRTISEQEAEYTRKVREGWKVIDGRLVSPADQGRALAEKRHREEEEAKRKKEEQQAAARAKAEADSLAQEQEQRPVAPATQLPPDMEIGRGTRAPAREELETPLRMVRGTGGLVVGLSFLFLGFILFGLGQLVIAVRDMAVNSYLTANTDISGLSRTPVPAGARTPRYRFIPFVAAVFDVVGSVHCLIGVGLIVYVLANL